MLRSLRLDVCLTLASCIAACGPNVAPRTYVPAADLAAISGRFDDAAIRAQVDDLSGKLSIDGPEQVVLREKLAALLEQPAFVAAMRERGVQAVGVYHWGEGGLVVKLARGSGTIRFAGVAGERSFDLEYTSIGAQVGGSASWGVVLALGLSSVEAIEGSYTGDVASATAIDQSAGVMRLDHQGRSLYFVGVAEGLSANAGGGKMVLALRD